jgi:uncharacterized membrane protein YkvA (DUF1232 family)
MSDAPCFCDFHAFLEKEINSYRGKVKSYVYYLPALFKALCGVLDEKDLSAEERRQVLAALGYLVAPNDVVPEAVYGPAGYTDDVFVCATVLDRLVKAHGVGFVEPYWEKETDEVGEFLQEAIEEAGKDLGDKVQQVIQFTGLA